MYSLGIDVGYSSVKLSLADDEGIITADIYHLHGGDVRKGLKASIGELQKKHPLNQIGFGAVTGRGSEILTSRGLIGVVSEVPALLEGILASYPEGGSVVEIGGQNGRFITDFSEGDSSRIKISVNSNCSAGTGSFLEEQVSRLDLKLQDYSRLASAARSIPRIAGRCSVFARTDIIHHQQEGIPVKDILQGLAYAVVRNYRGVVVKKAALSLPVIFTGGVAYNDSVKEALRNVFSLTEGDVMVPSFPGNMAARGAAMIAARDRMILDLGALLSALDDEVSAGTGDMPTMKSPSLSGFGAGDAAGRHLIIPGKNTGRIRAYLGVDVGSTSTNLVLMNENKDILACKYLKTLGDPLSAVKRGLAEIEREAGGGIEMAGVGVTGSGRYMIGEYLGADVIKDEITAQARAAITMDPGVDTVFEIGGQDSKYISIRNGAVESFQMNKICAAGTGCFIEEVSRKFRIPLDDFSSLALSSDSPLYLGDGCTVFIEAAIAAHISRGVRLEDIASGLCYSIVRNYLDRVVGQRKIGNRVLFQGGVAFNQGVINAFRALTEKEITVPPFFSVTGAYGAALLAHEEMKDGVTLSRGFDPHPAVIESGGPGVKDICDLETATSFSRQVEEVVFTDYDGIVDRGKKTVGIPRTLFTYGMFPFFNAFFRELGLNVLLSHPTCEETISLGQEYSLDEACFPLKLINGHVASLMAEPVDYIFFPDMFSVNHPGSEARRNYGCSYMQLAFKVVNQAMELDRKGIRLLSPTIAFSLGRDFMIRSFAGTGEILGKTPEESARALQKGLEAVSDYEKRIGEKGRSILKEAGLSEKVFVIVSKIYGVADPVLNMGVPDMLMEMGHRVLPFYMLPPENIFREHPNMYWPFGQHILEPAHLVREHPNLYAILLTHHGCGPDSVLSHYFREIMGDKPYLHLEVDEHHSRVGVATRVEAFVNSLAKEVTMAARLSDYSSGIVHSPVNISTDLSGLEKYRKVYLPDLYPYSRIFSALLVSRGIDASVIPPTDRESVDMGRRFSITEEYFSMTALVGDVIRLLEKSSESEDAAILLPQTEGAEVEGQYARLLRTRIDEEGYSSVGIISPFVEDALRNDRDLVSNLFLALLAGDIIRMGDRRYRNMLLQLTVEMVQEGTLSFAGIKEIASMVSREIDRNDSGKKRILAVGEIFVLYNDFLNNWVLAGLEEQGYKVFYGPMSEALWLMWRDWDLQQGGKESLKPVLHQFRDQIAEVSRCFSSGGHFEKDPRLLVSLADQNLGYYAGAFGRYRSAKTVGDHEGIDGIITVSSMYENTGISLNILEREWGKKRKTPLLNLTFDGNGKDSDRSRIESFLYYLK